MMLGPGGQPLRGAPIRTKSKYVCLQCGDVPYVAEHPVYAAQGIPECEIRQIEGEAGPSLHCLKCKIQIERKLYPCLVPLADAEAAFNQAAQEVLGDKS